MSSIRKRYELATDNGERLALLVGSAASARRTAKLVERDAAKLPPETIEQVVGELEVLAGCVVELAEVLELLSEELLG